VFDQGMFLYPEHDCSVFFFVKKICMELNNYHGWLMWSELHD
jgi:hypothetical protein